MIYFKIYYQKGFILTRYASNIKKMAHSIHIIELSIDITLGFFRMESSTAYANAPIAKIVNTRIILVISFEILEYVF